MWDFEKEQIVRKAQKLVEYKLVTGTAGNISLRVRDEFGAEYIIITPSGIHYDEMVVEDVAIVDFHGRHLEGRKKPSIETLLHLGVYSYRKKINSIIHTHSIYAMTLAVARMEIPPILDEQVVYLGGKIKIANHALPGTKELTENVISVLGSDNAVLMSNHGALVLGKNLDEAFDNCLLLERVAQVYVNALLLNKVRILPDEAIFKERALYDNSYMEERPQEDITKLFSDE